LLEGSGWQESTVENMLSNLMHPRTQPKSWLLSETQCEKVRTANPYYFDNPDVY
jgi:hypothetical protein